MDVNQYLALFIDESRDHLQSLNENVLALEGSPEDIEIVQHIFRSAHTLKGMSATMGFEDLASLTHDMENVLDLVRNRKLKMDPFIFDSFFKSLDALESMLEDIILGGTGKADVSGNIKSLKIIAADDYRQDGKGASAEISERSIADRQGAGLDQYQHAILRQAVQEGKPAFRITVSVREDCVLKAARAYMVFCVFEYNGEVIQSSPSVEEIEQDRFDRAFTVFYVSQTSQEELNKQISVISEIERVDFTLLDQDKLDEWIKPTANPAPVVSPENSAGDKEKVSLPEARKPSNPEGTPSVTRTIRVDTGRLDTLMNLFSELLIDRVRLEQLASEIRKSELTETVEHMARVSSDLQNIVLKLRMVQVDTVFNRFPRMIRDAAKSLDKKVELIITGAETELDRTVVEEIGDPLVHLLRNAVDHGLEPAADRLAAGKPEAGTIHLRAYHSGNHVFIEIEEDGRGINREGILKKAIQNGLVTPELAPRMTDEEVYMLLFAAGFSTAEKISDLSGRGVGLDVVKTKIESLGGRVQVESGWGRGSKFTLQLPLTLSIITAMMIGLKAEKYAIPLSSIVETTAIRKDQLRTVHGNRMFEYRDSVIPLIPLGRLFDVPGAADEAAEETQMVIIRKGDKLAGLVVDEFIGQQEIVLKSLGNYLARSYAVSGATILGDGQAALIMDTNALMK
ncbi:chemotaxis protein CheW [Cohnella sp.]|uniref:chemotaxis protein CheW n=1 Tax=Cohnella sp. TaxID=1883426 RepID=UPI00356A69CB